MTKPTGGTRSDTTEMVPGREAGGVRIGDVVKSSHGYGRGAGELEYEEHTGDRSVQLKLLSPTGR